VVGDVHHRDLPGAHEPLLVVDDLRTHFQLDAGTVRAVDGVSFDLTPGRTIGIVGESGSGKTVLARSIMRLNLGANVHTSGSVRFDGRDLLDLPPKAMPEVWGREMSMIFQDPMTSLNPVVKIGRQITEHVRRHLRLSKSESRELALQLLRDVRIPEAETRFDSYPHELSGGMRQRVSIAIALACGPKILFADEPTTALDVTVQHQILNLLARAQRERHMSVVLVTHDLGVVAGRTDDIAVMYAGKFVEHAPTSTLFAAVRHPYTEALLRSIPRTTQRNHTRLAAIAGRPPDLISPPTGCSFSPRCPYAQERCYHDEPPLVSAGADPHLFACWYPVGTPENADAYQRNLAAGRLQTLSVAKGLVVDDQVIDGEVAEHSAGASTAAAADLAAEVN
jgi:peptide/nickel transport system ATP-binding protein